MATFISSQAFIVDVDKSKKIIKCMLPDNVINTLRDTGVKIIDDNIVKVCFSKSQDCDAYINQNTTIKFTVKTQEFVSRYPNNFGQTVSYKKLTLKDIIPE